MKIQRFLLCLISFLLINFFSPSPLFANVSSGTCTVKDDSDDSGTLFTLRNRVDHGANLDQQQTCQDLIKFEAGETFHISLGSTLTFMNSDGLVIDGAGATVVIDEGSIPAGQYLFDIKNSDMHFKNMTIKAPQHLIEKIFNDEGYNNHHKDGEEGLVIISKNPSECGNGKVEDGEECDDNDGCCNSCHFAAEGKSCSGAPHGECNDHGKCVSPAHYCGDGQVDAGEECDDSGGCCDANTCMFKSEGTSCNDGNLLTIHDQCDGQGKCSGDPIQISYCGDGHIDAGEVCDDGNAANGDGCSSTCQVEDGWTCTTADPSVCIPLSPVCGNGIRETGEDCDDANTLSGDGCSATCQVEDGWTCTTADPSVCTRVPVCGDGVVSPENGEQCDSVGECCQACHFVADGSPCNGASGDQCDGHGVCKAAGTVNPVQNPAPSPTTSPTVCSGKFNHDCVVVGGDGCSLSFGNASSSSLFALASALIFMTGSRFRRRGK